MRVGQARETARQWVIEEASGIPGFAELTPPVRRTGFPMTLT
jgi:hypothetical protein